MPLESKSLTSARTGVTGSIWLSDDSNMFKLQGRGGHGARPWPKKSQAWRSYAWLCKTSAVSELWHTQTHKKKAEQLKTNLTFGKFLVFWSKLWRLSIQQQRGLLLSDAQTLWRFFVESDLEHRWMDMDFIWIHRMHQKHTACPTEKVVRKRMLKRGVLGSGTALAKTRTEW